MHCKAAGANDVGFIQVSHCLSTYPITVVRQPQPWDGNTYGLIGDLTCHQYQVTQFNDDITQLVGAGTRVFPDAETLTAIGANIDGLLPHVDVHTPNAIEVRTRQSMFVPFAYVNLLLGSPLTPKAAFARVYSAAIASNQVADCRTLLDYLKVACTVTQQNPDDSAVSGAWPSMPQPPNNALIQYIDRKVNQDLPDRAGVNQPKLQQLQPVITAIDNLTAEQRQQRIDAAACQQRTKNKQEFYGAEGVIKLMRLCQVHQETMLPPIWAELAATPKMGRLSTVQNAIEQHKRGCSVYIDISITSNSRVNIVV